MALTLDRDRARHDRLAQPSLQEAILGALAFLEDTQIRPRGGPGPLCTHATEGQPPHPLQVHLPWRKAGRFSWRSPLAGAAMNRAGEWASQVHYLPGKLGIRGLTLVVVQDSNLPCAAATAYPLGLFDETALPTSRRIIGPMLEGAARAATAYQNGGTSRFWSALPGTCSPFPRIGPPNIPVAFAEYMARHLTDPTGPLFRWLARRRQGVPRVWYRACFDPARNPAGADVLFNIAADADDTALGMILERIATGSAGPRTAREGAAIAALAAHRDIGRTRADVYNRWIGSDTGAFLTWLRSEDEPTFSNPELGVVPMCVNNVCVVVNANVVLALALTGATATPGYTDALRLIGHVIEHGTWPRAALYYPQRMMFPYAASRAFRDGGIREDPMPAAMRTLLGHLLDEQARWAVQHPRRRGAFPGGLDASDHLGTALGVSALLNVGRTTADAIGRGNDFDAALDAGVRRLLDTAYRRRCWHDTTRAAFGASGATVWEWDTGLFFASSYREMAHWRSRAYTVGAVLEALVKYALGIDADDAPLGQRRLALTDA